MQDLVHLMKEWGLYVFQGEAHAVPDPGAEADPNTPDDRAVAQSAAHGLGMSLDAHCTIRCNYRHHT